MSWKPCQVKFEQTLQETSLFCLKFWGAKSNMNARVRCGYKLYWIQTFYFHDKQFCSSFKVYRTLDSIILFLFTFQLTSL